MKKMESMNRKERMMSVITAVWAVVAFIICLAEGDIVGFIAVMAIIWLLPVTIFWGIYWIKQGNE